MEESILFATMVMEYLCIHSKVRILSAKCNHGNGSFSDLHQR